MQVVEAFLSLNSNDKNIIMYAIERRYEFDNINQRLAIELEPLLQIKAALEFKRESIGNKLSGYVLTSLIESHIDKVINKLKPVTEIHDAN